MRVEEDALGKVMVPDDCVWMSQTQRSLENFPISTEKMPESLIRSLVLLKKAAAMANFRLGRIDAFQESAIVSVCDRILAGELADAFPLSVWQTGSGTQSNMNVNEVIAYVGNLSFPDAHLLANDSVNASQSSNDIMPSALHVMVVSGVRERLFPVVDRCIAVLADLEERFAGVLKSGRTHLQDAAPLSFAQEISGWRAMLEQDREMIESALVPMLRLAVSGTAVGTGLNCPDGFGDLVCSYLNGWLGSDFCVAPNLFASLASRNGVVFLSGALKALAADMLKLANDVRWMASGPRCGLGELSIPENEPGSSIMPGKVNPTQCEQVSMVALQVMGNDAAVGMAAGQGNFELNVYLPLLAYDLDQNIRLLSDSLDSFVVRCLSGIVPTAKMEENVSRSLMLATALNPVIGYKKASLLARTAALENLSLAEANERLGFLDPVEFARIVDPSRMV